MHAKKDVPARMADLDFEATDPEFGTFTLRSVYRRAGKP